MSGAVLITRYMQSVFGAIDLPDQSARSLLGPCVLYGTGNTQNCPFWMKKDLGQTNLDSDLRCHSIKYHCPENEKAENVCGNTTTQIDRVDIDLGVIAQRRTLFYHLILDFVGKCRCFFAERANDDKPKRTNCSSQNNKINRNGPIFVG